MTHPQFVKYGQIVTTAIVAEARFDGRKRRLETCIGLVSLVEDEIRDEQRTDQSLRLAARVVRPSCSWSNGRLEMVGKIGGDGHPNRLNRTS